MSAENPKVDAFLRQSNQWREELEKLRAILLDTALTEDFKWKRPCYTFQKSNLVAIAGLKEDCWIAFFNGALLRDDAGILVKPGENSQSGRVIKFTSVQQIVKMEATLKAFVEQAIEAEKVGLKVEFKESRKLVFPQEFLEILNQTPGLKAAFEALTPGRRRAYNLHFSAAKRSATRTARIEKLIPRILSGKGLTDR